MADVPTDDPDNAVGVSLPIGTVTLLLTDIEGSTIGWEADGAAMADELAREDRPESPVRGEAATASSGHTQNPANGWNR